MACFRSLPDAVRSSAPTNLTLTRQRPDPVLTARSRKAKTNIVIPNGFVLRPAASPRSRRPGEPARF